MFSRVRLFLTISIGLLVLAACGDPVPPETGFEVAVTVVGDGNVTSTPAGIDTADNKTSATFAENAEVVLTATPIGNATFTNWTGGACEGSTDAVCTIADLTADTAVTANFTEDVDPGGDPLPFSVAVSNTATSDGSVTSDVGGIDCPGVCEGTAPEGSAVVLTAAVTTGGFVNWTGGDCDGQTGLTCTITVGPDEETVTANFGDVDTHNETATISGAVEELITGGAGNMANFPPGFNYTDSSDIDFGRDENDNDSQQWVGLRFSFAELPADATVQSAVITMTAKDAQSDVVNVTISGEAVAAAATFEDDANGTASFDASTRAANSTTATVAWDITEAWDATDAVTTPDLASILNEIVAIDGWGGDVVIFVSPDSDLASEGGRRVLNDGSIEMAVVWTTPVAP